MSYFDKKGRVLVTCPKELPRYLAVEIENLGFEVLDSLYAGVVTTGTLKDCIRLNLNLRTGHRVLYHLEDFKISRADELYKKIKTIPWEEIFDVDGYVSVTSSVLNNTITDTRFANLKCKDAIVDRFMDVYNRRPDSGPRTDKGVVFIHWKDDKASVYIDTSGESLNKRTYRVNPHKAPMIESLAAAVMLETGWDGEKTLINPMCGSGTLAIEAALIALNRAPGLQRDNFGFMHVKGYKNDYLRSEVIKAEERQKYKLNGRIYAGDVDPQAIAAAKRNAKIANVEKHIEFFTGDFRKMRVPEGGGVVVINPEYGMRLGEVQQLENIYRAMGDYFKQNCKGYMCYIFTGNMELAKKVGLSTKSKKIFFNSKIECRLLQYEIYDGSRKAKYQD